MTNASAVLVLVVFVVAVAASGDRLAGVVAALSSGAGFDFFLTEPFHQFVITDPNDLEATVLLVLVGTAVTELALWGRRQQDRAARQTGYLDGLLQTARTAAGGQASRDLVTGRVAQQIHHVLGVDRCDFVADREIDPQAPIIGQEGSVTQRGAYIDVDRAGLPVETETYLPVRSGGVTRGHYRLTAATRVVRPTLEQRRIAVLLADQLGSILAANATDGPSSRGSRPP